LQGFAGWMLIAFLIVLVFQYLAKPEPVNFRPANLAVAAVVPLGIYASAMVFQMLLGHPIETRVVAFFAMGIPSLAALVAWWHWRKEGSAA
jgi:ribose/xylose/arabinose/galactoside ABC-type transport system permease subunit